MANRGRYEHMRPSNESRTVLIGATIGVVVLILFVISLAAVALVSTADESPTTQSTANVVAVAESTPTTGLVVTSQPRSESVAPLAPSSEQTAEAAAVDSPAPPEPTQPPTVAATGAPPTEAPTAEPTTTTAPPSLTQPPTAAPPTATTARVAAAPAPTSAPDGATWLWPETLPEGMAFVPEDSWPFRVIALDRQAEPFLVFRGGPRWLLVRNQGGANQPIPGSAKTETVRVAGAPATLVTYASGGRKLVLERDGQTIQVSGDGLSVDDLRRTAETLRPLGAEALRSRLNQEAAKQPAHVTLLWPNLLPEGMAVAAAESRVQLAQPANGPRADSYRVVFRGADRSVVVGGGAEAVPRLAGATTPWSAGTVRGTLTAGERRFLLVLDGPVEADAPLNFPTAGSSGALVQRGRVWISTENVEWEQFNRVVAGLQPLGGQEFVARARGQNPTNLAYRWPTRLPPGYTIDRSAANVAWDDFVLQGGLPFFELIATGSGGTITIRGGRESGGQTLIVPEGPDVERVTATIHGRSASAARTRDGSVVVWSEDGTLYSINSRSVALDQLAPIGEGLQPIEAGEFFRRLQ